MDKAIFMAVNSIKADKIKQINAVHEVSNVSTVGFKKAFDLTVETFRVDLPGSYTSRFLLTPEELGVVDLTPGSRMATEQPLDIFIEGDGVLGVFNDDGEIGFTRRGDLRVSTNGVLVNGEGRVIAAEGGGQIELQPDLLYRISRDGVIYSSNTEEEVAEDVEVAQLLLRDASNTKLEKTPDGLFKVYGQPVGDFEGGENLVRVTSQALEGSSVKTYDVLAQMIEIERSYEMKINIVEQLKELDDSSTTLMQTA